MSGRLRELAAKAAREGSIPPLATRLIDKSLESLSDHRVLPLLAMNEFDIAMGEKGFHEAPLWFRKYQNHRALKANEVQNPNDVRNPKDIQKPKKDEWAAHHRHKIEKNLGWSFQSFMDLDLVFPVRGRKLHPKEVIRIPQPGNYLVLVGASALRLTMLHLNKPRVIIDAEALFEVGMAMGLNNHMMGLNPYRDMETKCYLEPEEIVALGVAGAFGAVFRDGGIKALEEVLQRKVIWRGVLKDTKSIDPVTEASKKDLVSRHTCEVLFADSCYKLALLDPNYLIFAREILGTKISNKEMEKVYDRPIQVARLKQRKVLRNQILAAVGILDPDMGASGEPLRDLCMAYGHG